MILLKKCTAMLIVIGDDRLALDDVSCCNYEYSQLNNKELVTTNITLFSNKYDPSFFLLKAIPAHGSIL